LLKKVWERGAGRAETAVFGGYRQNKKARIERREAYCQNDKCKKIIHDKNG
jgi:hypothetical protein